MGPRCSSAETQVCHRSYIIAASPKLKAKLKVDSAPFEIKYFELKDTSVYHFKMFLIDFNIKNSNIRNFVCNQETNVAGMATLIS